MPTTNDAARARRAAPRLFAAQDYERREQRRVNAWSAYGYLTLVNAPFVYARLRSMFVGKRYTWVAVNENLDLLRPEVRASEHFKDGPGNWTDGARDGGIRISTKSLSDGRPWVHIMAGTTYGVWSIDTSLRDNEDVRRYMKERDGHVGHHHMSDPDLKGRDYDVVYFQFEGDRSVTFNLRTMAGGRVTWVLAVEEDHDLAHAVEEAANLLAEHVDDEMCDFDHHGYCRTHGGAGEKVPYWCSNARAKAFIRDHGKQEVPA